MLNIAIAILWILDTAILVLLPYLDKQLYRGCPQVQTARFFCNPGYGHSFERFAYSSGGLLLWSVSLMVVVKLYGHEW